MGGRAESGGDDVVADVGWDETPVEGLSVVDAGNEGKGREDGGDEDRVADDEVGGEAGVR